MTTKMAPHTKRRLRRSKTRISRYDGPAGGWGSVKSLLEILGRERVPLSGAAALTQQNKVGGFACVSCAWPKPAEPHAFEFCENGAKATAWEITSRRAGPEFFAAHTLGELETWPDFDLEQTGRLVHPMRWDARLDKYVPVDWAAAFAEIGRELKSCDPKAVVLYASGRASLETSYMYALFARLLGTNNLPDSSNMCHETTSVALPETIGVPVGTVTLDDFQHTDCIFFFGQNVGSNSPRMLHDLQDAVRRGVPIVTFNPLREPGLVSFTNPQSPAEMLTLSETKVSAQYHQVKAGGDLAAITGMCKAVLELDADAQNADFVRIVDVNFITEHTHGFDAFADYLRASRWEDLEDYSGLKQADMRKAASVYAKAKSVIGIYGMGLTQHRRGVETVQMLTNLLLMRGNIGKEGAGICPVRGHSNVQGQRTVGITEKPELVPLDKLAAQFNFDPPRDKGLNTVEVCEGIINGEVRAFIGLGGNFIRAIPDRDPMEEAWRKLRLTVQVATKLNRSHLIHGEISYLLPCLGRLEIDNQASGPQSVSIEDSTACVHGSIGLAPPASRDLLSEAKIVAEIAKATLEPNDRVDWDGWVADYATVRDLIAETYPADFHDFNARMFQPGGFHRNIAARRRQWKTKNGKANFIVPRALSEDPDMPERNPNTLRLMTLRSNDQFNTTIYGYDDRFRGIAGTRNVVLINRFDMDRLDLVEGESVSLVTDCDDRHREVAGLRVTQYDIPPGCVGGYYPECNPLIPLWHHAERSKVPAAKSIPVKIIRARGAIGDHDFGAVKFQRPAHGDFVAAAFHDLHAGSREVVELARRATRRRPLLAVVCAVVGGILASALLNRWKR